MYFEDLILRIEVLDSGESDIFTTEELERFEHQHGCLLPIDYKDFCCTLGTGQFGDYMRVFCPRAENLREASKILRRSLERFQENRNNPSVSTEISGIVDFSLFFGMNPNGQVIVWDSRTYSESDHCYDIYLIPLDYWNKVHFIGRKFCDFIEDL